VNLGLLDEASKVLMTKGKKYINWTSSKLKRFVLYRTSSRSQCGGVPLKSQHSEGGDRKITCSMTTWPTQ
jgi:hypothetical protein